MRKFFHAHPDVVLVTLAIVLLAALAACYSWAINGIYTEVHEALTSSLPPSSDAFDLAGAAKLDLRGLVSGSSSAPVAGAPASASALISSSTSTSTADTAATSSSAATTTAAAHSKK
jgi:hypothetical protein